MIRRLVPHPLLSLTLLIVWLALVNTVTLGHLILGSVIGDDNLRIQRIEEGWSKESRKGPFGLGRSK